MKNINYITVLFIFLFTLTAYGVNDFDSSMQNTLTWKNSKLANELSDITLNTMLYGSIAYSLGNKKLKKPMLTPLITHLSNSALTTLTKSIAGRKRPNGASYKSFFSGHTSAAFTGAGLVCRQSLNYCLPSIIISTATGYFRIAANKHWTTDVLAGAGVGFLFGFFMPEITF